MPTYRDDLPERPARIAALPLNDKGYPVPYFVAWIDGAPDFRIADPEKMRHCVREKRCWICGQVLGKFQAFAIGPMCVVNRVSSEPPSHRDCVRYAARACPFLMHPRAQRREANFPDEAHPMPGITVTRNPGVIALWNSSLPYSMFRAPGGFLFRVPEPDAIEWYAEGRTATPAEVRESFDSGVVILREVAHAQGVDAEQQIDREVARALHYLPESVSA